MEVAEVARIGRIRIADQLEGQQPMKPADLAPQVGPEVGRLSKPRDQAQKSALRCLPAEQQ
ncbi:hypothetical protein SAMN05444007_11430 [Cribrihabitans marinus]|uniref:Uncharacterized protein n=1 Tax=Cribrihabitans marinus TaxID=1227549 RepID=A0A1H7DWM6_9RHOB|nr:hypothetical protein SAMN05444007_11430 [Cribrihabitans marinus]